MAPSWRRSAQSSRPTRRTSGTCCVCGSCMATVLTLFWRMMVLRRMVAVADYPAPAAALSMVGHLPYMPAQLCGLPRTGRIRNARILQPRLPFAMQRWGSYVRRYVCRSDLEYASVRADKCNEVFIALGQNTNLGRTRCMCELILWSTGDAEAGVKTPQKTDWCSNTIAEEPEEEEAGGSGNRPHALSASACQQVWLRQPACATHVPCSDCLQQIADCKCVNTSPLFSQQSYVLSCSGYTL